jgi:hypothetical protein
VLAAAVYTFGEVNSGGGTVNAVIIILLTAQTILLWNPEFE